MEETMTHSLRIAYLDVGFSLEDYSLQPRRYGGGGVFGRYAKEDSEMECYVFAPQRALENINVDTERADRCIGLPDDLCQALQHGLPIDQLLQHFPPFDLVLHGHTCYSPQRGGYKGPVCHWSGFDGKAGHYQNDYVLFYNDTFTPRFGERAKYVRIGKPVPTEWSSSFYLAKERFVFQCSRHDPTMGSVELAKQCLAEGFKGVFAGPIHGDYPLRDYIDGKTTIYLGEISEAEKLAWCRRASLFGLLHNWPTMSFNQSCIEAQGQGTPLYTRGVGPFLGGYLKHRVNGFEACEQSLWIAYTAADAGMSYASWRAAREYDVSVMVASFKQAFADIVAEWRVEHPSPL